MKRLYEENNINYQCLDPLLKVLVLLFIITAIARSDDMSAVAPTCSNLQNGLTLSTYNISNYSHHYPSDHNEYNDLVNNYAKDDYLFGKGRVDNIDTTGSNNNPFHEGTDEKYLAIFQEYIYIPQAGTYSFAVNGDDAVEVIFNDTQTLGWYGGHGSDGTGHNKEFTFNAAGYYKLEFRQQEWGGGDSYQLYWKKPGESSYSIVPIGNLFHCALPSPIVNYRMDECSWDGSADEVRDSSNNSLHATAKKGATTASEAQVLRSGKFSNKSYVFREDDDLLDDSSEITLMAWFNPSVLDGKPRGILSKRVTYGNSGQGAYSIFFYSSNKIYIDINSNNDRFFIDNNFIKNQWYHIAVTFDGKKEASQRVKVYIDGILSKTAKESSDTIANYDSNLFVGILNEGYPYGFEGYIDEVKIFDQALSDSDIQQIYNNENSKKNYDGSERSSGLCSVAPTCNNLQNGLELSTFDISNYSHHYPSDHNEYNDLVNNYAKNDYLFGKGRVDNIDTTGSNNNPFHEGTDEKYLAIFQEYIYIPQAGTYSFAVNGDDAVEVIFNDTQTLGWYGGHGSDGTGHNKEFTFNAAGYYKLEFRQQEWGGGDSYQLYWKKPGESSYSIVPIGNLFYCALSSAVDNYRFDVWDTFRDIYDRNISTEIANKDFNLIINSLNETDDNYQEFNGTLCSRIVDFKHSNMPKSPWIKTTFSDANSSLVGYRVNDALEEARVALKWQKNIDVDCDSMVEDNATLSTDAFSIRPESFTCNFTTGTLVAEHNYTSQTIRAVDALGNATQDYNTTLPIHLNYYMNSGERNDSIKKVDLQYGSLGVFEDGNSNGYLYYGDVGVVGIDINDSTWAEVDSDDTNEANRTIYTECNQTFRADHFELNLTVPIMENNSTFTYLSNDLNMSAWVRNLNLTVTAKGEANGTLQNYQEPQTLYFAKNVDVTPILTIPDTPYGDVANTLDTPVSETDTNLSFKQGIADINYSDVRFNYPRNFDDPKNPFLIKGEDGSFGVDINEHIETAVKGDKITALDDNATFYFGRLHPKDVKTTDDPALTTIEIEVFDNNGSNFVQNFRQNSLHWYRHANHNSGAQGDVISIHAMRDLTLNTPSVFDLNPSDIADPSNGTIQLSIPKHDGRYDLHVKTQPWLWYVPSGFGNAYDDSDGSQCTEHPCFNYTSKASDGANEISSGNFSGSDVVKKDRGSYTKKGIKVFR